MTGQDLFYIVTFENGDTQEEYGASEADVRDFIARSFKFKGPIKSVVLHPTFS